MENDEMEVIAFTKVKLPFGWLGNMSPHGVTFSNQHGERFWPTTEHLFQCMRLPEGHEVVEKVLMNKNPMAAKLAVKAFSKDFIVPPLSDQDLNNMRVCLEQKVLQHTSLSTELKNTGSLLIIEDVSSRANKGSALFWGAAFDGTNWNGQNWLGKLWMELRDKI